MAVQSDLDTLLYIAIRKKRQKLAKKEVKDIKEIHRIGMVNKHKKLLAY